MFRKRVLSALLIGMMIIISGCGASERQESDIERESNTIKESTEEKAASETAETEAMSYPDTDTEVHHIQTGIERREHYIGESNLEATTFKVIFWNQEDEEKYPELAKSLADYADKISRECDEASEALLEKAQTHVINAEGSYSFSERWEPTILRSDSRVVSVGVERTHLEGSDGGTIWYTGAVFDSQTGKELTFNDVVVDKKAFFDKALERAETIFYYDYRLGNGPNAEERFAELSEMDEPDMKWTMDSEAVYVLFHGKEFGPYEMADYAVPVYFNEAPEIFASIYTERPESYMIPCVDDYLTYYLDVNGDGFEEEIKTEPMAQGVDEIDRELWSYAVVGWDRLELEQESLDESHYIAYVNGQYYMLLEQQTTEDLFRSAKISLVNLKTMEETDAVYGYPMDLQNQSVWELTKENNYTYGQVACAMTDPDNFYLGNKEDTITSYLEFALWKIDNQNQISWKEGSFTEIQCSNVLKLGKEITVDVVDGEGNVIGSEVLKEGTLLNMVRAYMDETYIDFQIVEEKDVEYDQWSEGYDKKYDIRFDSQKPIYRLDWKEHSDDFLGKVFWG